MALATYPQEWLWTRKDYYYAGEQGVFRPDARLELLEGKVLNKVSPQGDPHALGLGLSATQLRNVFTDGFSIREEKPMVLSDRSEPEPDIMVVRGTLYTKPRHPHPADVVLLMEISDSTLAFDQGAKAALYARAGIQDYWILNLRQRCLEVRRDPIPLEVGGWGYNTLITVLADGEIAPLASPDTPIRVADILPFRWLAKDEDEDTAEVA